MGGGDGSGPGHNALKNQVVGFLFAAAYLRGACHAVCWVFCVRDSQWLENAAERWDDDAVPLIVINVMTILVKIIFG